MDKIRFDQIRIFIEVAKTLSFTKAAENLYISQSTISKWITHLEKELDIKLFNRTSRSVSLSEAGEQLFIKWTSLYEAFEISIIDARRLYAPNDMEINLGLLHHFDFEKWVPDLGSVFEQTTPPYKLNYSVYSFKELKFKAEDLDIIFTTDLEAESMPDYEMKIINEVDLFLIVSKYHPLANRKDVSMHDVKDETFYIFSQEISPKGITRVKRAFEEREISPRFVFVDNISSQFLNVVRTKGVAIANLASAKTYGEDVVTIPFTDLNFKVYSACLWHKENKKPGITSLLAFLTNYVKRI